MDPTANIFPFILDTLSQKPLLEETEKNLLRDLRQKIKNQGLKINNLKKEFEQTLEIGQAIGILRVMDTNVRLPFSLGNIKQKADSTRSKSVPLSTDKERNSRRRGRRSSRGRRQSRSRSGRRARTQRRRNRSSRK